MSVFTDSELRYLTGGRQLGRIAMVGPNGTPHVVPVGWIYNAACDTIDIGGHERNDQEVPRHRGGPGGLRS
jgi:pyridoxamine 5'-phosphate oxidase family protein